MCGICGLVGQGDASVLARMMRRLEHRGPDEQGMHQEPGIRLGMQRLRAPCCGHDMLAFDRSPSPLAGPLPAESLGQSAGRAIDLVDVPSPVCGWLCVGLDEGKARRGLAVTRTAMPAG